MERKVVNYGTNTIIEAFMTKKAKLNELSDIELLIIDLHETSMNNCDDYKRHTANSLLTHYLRYKSLTLKQRILARQIIK